MNIAKEILELNDLWQNTDKDIIMENINDLLINNGCTDVMDCRKMLQEITGSNNHAVYSWYNRSRKDVKIPFLKLCLVAAKYDVDLRDLLREATEESDD